MIQFKKMRWSALAAALLVSGCGGGSSGPQNFAADGTNSSAAGTSASQKRGALTGPTLTPEQKEAALEALRVKFVAIKAQYPGDLRAQNLALLKYSTQQPTFARAMLSQQSLWVLFGDGEACQVASNRANTPVPGAKQDARRAVQRVAAAPNGTTAYVVNTLDSWSNSVTDVSAMLSKKGYSPASPNPDLNFFQSFSGAAVLYLDGHGGVLDATKAETYNAITHETKIEDLSAELGFSSLFSLKTTTPYTAAIERSRGGELADHTLVAMLDEKGSAKTVGITAKFIRKYWLPANSRLSKHAFVFLNCCCSADAEFRAAVQAAGASTYLGWQNPVENGNAVFAGKLMMDRLLGTNTFLNSGPKLRPYDVQPVLDAYPGYFQAGGAKLVASTDDYSSPTLAPSIRNLFVNEHARSGDRPELYINGTFGADPGASKRQVSVGGTDLEVKSWDKVQVVAYLPRNPGAGFSGNTKLTLRGHVSNKLPLSLWHGTYTYRVLVAPGTNWQHQLVFDAYLRGDIHRYRETPAGDLKYPADIPYQICPKPTHGTYTGSGSTGGFPMVGNETLNHGLNASPAPYGTGYDWNGFLNVEDGNISAQISILGCVSTVQTQPASTQVMPRAESFFYNASKPNDFKFYLQSNGTIAADDRTDPKLQESQQNAHFKWEAVVPDPAPPLNGAEDVS